MAAKSFFKKFNVSSEVIETYRAVDNSHNYVKIELLIELIKKTCQASLKSTLWRFRRTIRINFYLNL